MESTAILEMLLHITDVYGGYENSSLKDRYLLSVKNM